MRLARKETREQLREMLLKPFERHEDTDAQAIWGIRSLSVTRNGESKILLEGIGFFRTSSKPSFQYIFKTPEQREQFIIEWLDRCRRQIAQRKAWTESQKTARGAVEPKVGDILSASWGYDQTNVDWYQVTKVSGSMVSIRKICATFTETGFMSGDCSPRPDIFVEGAPELRRRVNASRDGYSVKATECSWARLAPGGADASMGWTSYA